MTLRGPGREEQVQLRSVDDGAAPALVLQSEGQCERSNNSPAVALVVVPAINPASPRLFDCLGVEILGDDAGTAIAWVLLSGSSTTACGSLLTGATPRGNLTPDSDCDIANGWAINPGYIAVARLDVSRATRGTAAVDRVGCHQRMC